VDLPGLTRLRACPDYDDLTEVEHSAVLDARELLDELRPQGYGVTLARTGALRVVPPAGADKEARSRIAALVPALAYVLRLERWADPLPAACRQCAAPVDAFSPNGHPYCSPCYAVAAARHERRQRETVALREPGSAGVDADASPAARRAVPGPGRGGYVTGFAGVWPSGGEASGG
jgi:hypothetical protein